MTQQLVLPFTSATAYPPADNVAQGARDGAKQQPSAQPPETVALGAFLRSFRRMKLSGRPEFHVEYRPYAGLRSTIHLRGGQIRVSLSDVLAESPPTVLEALAEILLAKLFRRRASREARECYLAHIFKESTRHRIEAIRRMRGYKKQGSAKGRHFDLVEIFAGLNGRYFQGRLAQPRLGWSAKRARTVLGHYDSAHQSITISRYLDSPSVPRYLLEYIMFHEMLHSVCPVIRNGHRRIVHSQEFQQAERKFAHYEQARRRLKRLFGHALESSE